MDESEIISTQIHNEAQNYDSGSISDELKIFINLANQDCLEKILYGSVKHSSRLVEYLIDLNNINKSINFCDFSDTIKNKYIVLKKEFNKEIHISDDMRTFDLHIISTLSKQCTKTELKNSITIKNDITVFSRKINHTITQLILTKLIGIEMIRIELEEESLTNESKIKKPKEGMINDPPVKKTRFMNFPNSCKLILTDSNQNESQLDLIKLTGTKNIKVQNKVIQLLEPRDNLAIKSFLFYCYFQIYLIYKNSENDALCINNLVHWHRLTIAIRRLQHNFLKYVTSDKFYILQKVEAGRKTAKEQKIILDVLNDKTDNYISSQIKNFENLKSPVPFYMPEYISYFIRDIWKKDFTYAQEIKDTHNVKSNLYTGSSKNFEHFIKNLHDPLGHVRYKYICLEVQKHLVILSRTLDLFKLHTFIYNFEALCIPQIKSGIMEAFQISLLGQALEEFSLSDEYHLHHLQIIKNVIL